MTDLSAIFAEQQTNVIDWKGTLTYGIIELSDVPSRLRVTFESAAATPVQGIQLRMKGGTLEVNGHEGTNVVLWQDSSPTTVNIDVRVCGRGKPELKLWNVWRGGLDVTQAWLGNSAMQLGGDPASGAFRIYCSDGQGEPTFDDLVVSVETNRVAECEDYLDELTHEYPHETSWSGPVQTYPPRN